MLVRIGILILVVGFIGKCFSFRPSKIDFAIQDSDYKGKESKKGTVWIKMAGIPKSLYYPGVENYEINITYSIAKYLRNTKRFERVEIYYFNSSKLSTEDLLLEFQFSKLSETERFHTLFFPLSLVGWGITFVQFASSTGFVLYSLLGGPQMENQLEYKGNLILYDSQNKEIARVPIQYESKFNSNFPYYEKSYGANEERKIMMDELFTKVFSKLELR